LTLYLVDSFQHILHNGPLDIGLGVHPKQEALLVLTTDNLKFQDILIELLLFYDN